ncbi:hypothetical protein HNP84_002304 [Thermocatellispora tengchongensis]|uniref:DUF397 domain-containing protein n=1 Tax=Thermocatellispora tengchongensis TaxID=1073253 RepID=A0A840NYM0_9ACTN|nr:DUF397 domain-containing protein [Thermocatellispora tengchongensis]MBB5132588.1 hypothetical protein [Thermocatellispora tengchongensis]
MERGTWHTNPIDPATLTWRKSRRSDGGNGCVEVAVADSAPADAPHKANRGPLVLIRDSENPTGPVLAFTESELRAFFDGVKDGEFDDLI